MLFNIFIILFHCWLGVSKSIRPVEVDCEVLAWLSVWSEVQIVCMWSSWCRCHPETSIILPFYSHTGFTFLVSCSEFCVTGCSGKEAIKWCSVVVSSLDSLKWNQSEIKWLPMLSVYVALSDTELSMICHRRVARQHLLLAQPYFLISMKLHKSMIYRNFLYNIFLCCFTAGLQCFDDVIWAAGRAFGL